MTLYSMLPLACTGTYGTYRETCRTVRTVQQYRMIPYRSISAAASSYYTGKHLELKQKYFAAGPVLVRVPRHHRSDETRNIQRNNNKI